MARIPTEAGRDRIAEARVAGKGVNHPIHPLIRHGIPLPVIMRLPSARSGTVVGPDEHPADDLTIDELQIITTPEEPARERLGHGIILGHRREQANRKLRILERPVCDLDRPKQAGSTVEFVVHRSMGHAGGPNTSGLEILRQEPRRHGPGVFDPDSIRVVARESIRRNRENRARRDDDRDHTQDLGKRR